MSLLCLSKCLSIHHVCIYLNEEGEREGGETVGEQKCIYS